MPLSMNHVFRKPAIRDTLTKIIQHVDTRLNLGHTRLRGYRYGCSYRFHIVGIADEQTKQEFSRLYSNAGWERPTLINSEDEGKMPGLITAILGFRAEHGTDLT